MKNNITLLLVNPWIFDFAAYNLWSEPLGLLYAGSLLKKAGARISFIDCLHSTDRPDTAAKPDGRSKFPRTVIDAPPALEFMDREYARYGMDEEEFIRRLAAAGRPDAVMVTSMMTYWYPGVFRAIDLVREAFGPDVPVLLGGIYATLCASHARSRSGADEVYGGRFGAGVFEAIEKLTGKTLPRPRLPERFSDYPLPLHELWGPRRFVAVLSGTGCPFSCSYCASDILTGDHERRRVESVLGELRTFARGGNAAFYDDALLHDAENHFLPLARALLEEGLDASLHLPNGVHARFVTGEVARAMAEAGVRTIRLGLETVNESLQIQTGGKTTNSDYRRAVALLREAGYSRGEIGTYAMIGMPGQTPAEVHATVDFIHRCGGTPHLACYSPIPGTALWGKAMRESPFPLAEDPLFHNNTVFVRGCDAFSAESLEELREKVRELRASG
jgi:radical SAM superfamily enzyme YgiQ (UPF0313 family)